MRALPVYRHAIRPDVRQGMPVVQGEALAEGADGGYRREERGQRGQGGPNCLGLRDGIIEDHDQWCGMPTGGSSSKRGMIDWREVIGAIDRKETLAVLEVKFTVL